MQYRNSKNGYGVVSRALHWGMALAIFGMFGLGVWMRTLTYYSPYYKIAPDLHKSIGLVLLALLVARFIWRLVNPAPDDGYLRPIERKASHLLHLAFYGLLVVLMAAGFMISTVDGRGIVVFGLFEIPSVYAQKGLEDVVGFIHAWLAYVLIAFAALHATAALKHHFIDRDVTLLRMLRGDPKKLTQP